MVSIENFYWTLHQYLLRPANLDAWYFFPFGTTEILSTDEFAPKREPSDEHHVLFQFDQEPIWDLNEVYGLNLEPPRQIWSTKLCRLLANSEHSELKLQACRHHNMLDWYFFFHGFAALDWFRDAKYAPDSIAISDAWISLNHLVMHRRSYRLALAARFADLDIIDRGSMSLYATPDDCESVLKDQNSGLSAKDRVLITKHFFEHDRLPMKLDQVSVGGDLSAHFGFHQYKLWQQSLWHVVNETVFYETKLHLTEKVFKPIVSMRPFVLVAAPGNLRYLRSYGFRTFDDWIDESYDDEPDPEKRLDMIAGEIAKISDRSLDQLKAMQRDMMPVLVYNKNHFFTKFRRLIVDELVDNFDACIRVWNNGRIDDRQLRQHPDLESVKKLLLS